MKHSVVYLGGGWYLAGPIYSLRPFAKHGFCSIPDLNDAIELTIRGLEEAYRADPECVVFECDGGLVLARPPCVVTSILAPDRVPDATCPGPRTIPDVVASLRVTSERLRFA